MPRPIRSNTAVSGILDAPLSRSMTAKGVKGFFQEMLRHSRGAIAPESLAASPSDDRGRRECRVKASPAAPVHHKKHGEGTTGSARSSSIPCAVVLALIAGSLGTGLSCSHRPRDHLANLTPASGCQDHTPSRPHQHRSSARRTRARRQHVHRIPASRVVTIAIRPSASRRDARTILLIFGICKGKYFLRGD